MTAAGRLHGGHNELSEQTAEVVQHLPSPQKAKECICHWEIGVPSDIRETLSDCQTEYKGWDCGSSSVLVYEEGEHGEMQAYTERSSSPGE